jgi:RNA polymerase sigma factor (sigma-70 family)
MFAAVTGARKRAAVEMIAREGAELRQVARRYSLCGEDAEDAYQRALEIVLTKAPSERPQDLVRWTTTVVKHEALAIRRNRERLLGPAAAVREGEEDRDRIALLPAAEDGPDERLQRREDVARSREALQALRPAELRSLTLLAAGYSYAEIGEITGFSRTKVNRSLAEGRERFRRIVSGSESGARCEEMRPLLSAFCDGEVGAEREATVREHLRACAGCRAAMRAYRSAPVAAAALAPALPVSRSLLERAQELLAGVQSRLPGGTAEAGVAQMAAAGGSRGVGIATLAKLLAVCAGTAGGAAACVATGVTPASLDLTPERSTEPQIERVAKRTTATSAPAVAREPAPQPDPEPTAEPKHQPKATAKPAAVSEPAAAEAEAVEYAPPPPEPAPVPASAPAATSGGSAVGEFGP